MSENNGNKGGMIVLLIFLLICSGLGIAAFTMSFTKKCGEGFCREVSFFCDNDDDCCTGNCIENAPGATNMKTCQPYD